MLAKTIKLNLKETDSDSRVFIAVPLRDDHTIKLKIELELLLYDSGFDMTCQHHDQVFDGDWAADGFGVRTWWSVWRYAPQPEPPLPICKALVKKVIRSLKDVKDTLLS